MKLHIPTAIVTVGVVGLAALLSGQQAIGSISSLRRPVKVLGIPAPDEWIDIESNAVGQPATTYTVPDGYRLTLRLLARSEHFTPQGWESQRNMSPLVAINGAPFISFVPTDWTNPGEFTFAGAGIRAWTIMEGTVLHPGDTLLVERLDDGNLIANPAPPSHTFTVRGFLEKVH